MILARLFVDLLQRKTLICPILCPLRSMGLFVANHKTLACPDDFAPTCVSYPTSDPRIPFRVLRLPYPSTISWGLLFQRALAKATTPPPIRARQKQRHKLPLPQFNNPLSLSPLPHTNCPLPFPTPLLFLRC